MFLLAASTPFFVFAHAPMIDGPTVALVDREVARELGLTINAESKIAGVVKTTLTPEQAEQISVYQHGKGKCGGFQVVVEDSFDFSSLENRIQIESAYLSIVRPQSLLPKPQNAKIKTAIDKVNGANIRSFVEWFSSYPDRFNRGSNPNRAITALKEKLENLMKDSKLKWSVDEIAHNNTPQKSIRLTIPGTKNPEQIVVLGGHADSINQWGFGIAKAPGADDNASGSGTLFEALRILSENGEQPQRTIEFFWYAGEESGLLGSAEIAASYKQASKDVVAVLQLDMTAYPGKGSGKIGNVQDYTSSWLKDYLVEINKTYLGLTLVDDRCGYACSDHASWYEKGYPTLMPFESDTDSMNKYIHTDRDVVSILDFNHAAHFGKIALIFAMDLANSDVREPVQ